MDTPPSAKLMKFCTHCQAEYEVPGEHWKIRIVNRKTPIQYYCYKHKNEVNRRWFHSCREYNHIKAKQYYKEHRDTILKYQKAYYLKNDQHIKDYQKEYVIKHREKVRARRYKYSSRPEERIRCRVSGAIHDMIKGKQGAFRYLPYKKNELIHHLQSKFQHGMNFSNYGEWHIDHIIPCKLKTVNGSYYWNQEELANPHSFTFQQFWSLSNLQPMWAIDNIKKGNHYAG